MIKKLIKLFSSIHFHEWSEYEVIQEGPIRHGSSPLVQMITKTVNWRVVGVAKLWRRKCKCGYEEEFWEKLYF